MRRVVASVLAIMSAAAGPAGTDEGVVEKEQLFSQLGSMTEGTQVRLEDVVIRQKSGNVMRVGDRHHHQMFVVPVDPSSLEFLTVGAHVDVLGTLRRTPSAGQARLVYAMSRGAAWQFARDRYFIDAGTVVSR
jgi:hypothetical protein